MTVPSGTVIGLVVSKRLPKTPPELLASLPLAVPVLGLEEHPASAKAAAREAASPTEPRPLLFSIPHLHPSLSKALRFPRADSTKLFVTNTWENGQSSPRASRCCRSAF